MPKENRPAFIFPGYVVNNPMTVIGFDGVLPKELNAAIVILCMNSLEPTHEVGSIFRTGGG